jgi:hypothetical protein
LIGVGMLTGVADARPVLADEASERPAADFAELHDGVLDA